MGEVITAKRTPACSSRSPAALHDGTFVYTAAYETGHATWDHLRVEVTQRITLLNVSDDACLTRGGCFVHARFDDGPDVPYHIDAYYEYWPFDRLTVETTMVLQYDGPSPWHSRNRTFTLLLCIVNPDTPERNYCKCHALIAATKDPQGFFTLVSS